MKNRAILLTGIFLGMAFFIPGVSLAASPVVDSFDSFNIEGWQTMNFGSVLLSPTTTNCVSQGCVYGVGTAGVGQARWMYNTGTFTSAGGLRVWVMTDPGTSFGTIQICATVSNVGDDCSSPNGGGSRISYQTTAFGDSQWHSIDIIFEPTATTTRWQALTDAGPNPVLSNSWNYLAVPTSWPYIFNQVQLYATASIGATVWFDELTPAFAINDFSYGNLVSQGSFISTTTAQQFCSGISTSSTGFIDSVGQSVSQGLCVVAAYLFVPSQTALFQFQSTMSLAQLKVPFSYFYELNNLYGTLNSTTSDFVNIGFDISSTTVCSTSLGCLVPPVTALSTSTVSVYIPPDTLVVLRTLMSSVVWLGFAIYAYRRVLSLLHKK